MTATSNKQSLTIDFFFVGVGKSGTSWLYEFLGRVEGASVPSLKEPYILDLDGSSLRSAEKLFSRGAANHCDFSGTYYWDETNPQKIVEHNSEARVVVTVRRPSSRITSHFGFLKRNGLVNADQSLPDYLATGDEFEIVERSNYQPIIDRYRSVLGERRVLVLPMELLRDDPQQYADRLLSFMDLPPQRLTEEDKQPVLKAASARSPLAALVAKRTAELLRAVGLLRLLGLLKRSRRIRQVLFKESSGDGAPHAETQIPRIAELDSIYDERLPAWCSPC